MRKRALSLAITLCMILAMLPAMSLTVSAVDAPAYDSTNKRFFANGTPTVVRQNGGIVSAYLSDGTLLSGAEDLGTYVIYGGWESGDQVGDTDLTIESGTFTSTVYGGSREGTIDGDTNLTIIGGTFRGGVYGGSAIAGADVTGTANVTVKGATFDNCTVFGGGLQANTVGATNVLIKDGNFAWVYGGGDYGSVTGEAKLTIEGGTFSQTIFGGSDSGTVGSTDITIKDGIFKWIYGGGYNGTVTGNTVITIDGGTFENNIFGGGSQLAATVEGSTYITLNSGNYPFVFGGGFAGSVTGDTNIEVTSGYFIFDYGQGEGYGIIYGGGSRESASVGGTANIAVNATDDIVSPGDGLPNRVNVYGGGLSAPVGSTDIRISGGEFLNVHGGGLFTTATVQNSSVTIENNAVIYALYGGGNTGSVSGEIEVLVKDSAKIESRILGGCSNIGISYPDNPNQGQYGNAGNVKITIQDNAVIGGIVAGGTSGGTTAGVVINLRGGTVNGEPGAFDHVVYGGGVKGFEDSGKEGTVFGAAVINLHSDAVLGASGTGTITERGEDGSTVGAGSKINTYYKITYDENGGSGTVPADQYTLSGDSVTVADGSALSNGDRIFDGWNTEANGSGDPYAAGDSLTLNQNETLYAQWAMPPLAGDVSITLSGDADGNGVISIGDTLTADVSAVLPAAAQAGLVYAWYHIAGGIGSQISTASSVTIPSDVGVDDEIVLHVFHIDYIGQLSATVEIDKVPLTGTATITVGSGGATVGSTLMLNGSVSGTQGDDYDIVWLRDDAPIADAADMTYTITKLDLGKTITAKAVGKGDYSGEVFANSPVAIPAVVPDAPVVMATARNGQITLSWSTTTFDGGSPIIGYQVSKDNGASWVAAAGHIGHTFTGLTNGTAYTFKVRAMNSVGAGPEATVSATPTSGGGTTSQPKIGDITGWPDIIGEIKDTKPGETITIDMNGTTTLDGKLLDVVAGKDIDVILDMGEDLSWTISGTDVDVKLGGYRNVSLGIMQGGSYLPATVKKPEGSFGEVQLRLTHNGAFGFTMTLTATVGKEYKDCFANLFYYNSTAKNLEFKAVSRIGEDGTAVFPFDHAGDYLIVIADVNLDPSQESVWQNPFTDVSEHDWFFGDVRYVYKNGLMNGTSGTVFAPNVTLNRAMLTTILWRAEGTPEPDPVYAAHMMDVEQGSWYEKAMGWAAENDILEGYGEGFYGPNDPVTREQFVTILYRYAGLPALTARQLDFCDAEKVSDWAYDALVWATTEGIIRGKPGNLFDPQGTATRAEAAAILHRFIQQ